jgi:hypothetical protein
MEQQQDWETLIAGRNEMHGTVMTLRIDDAAKRRRYMNALRYKTNDPIYKILLRKWDAEYREKNKEKRRQYDREYRLSHLEYFKEKSVKYRARYKERRNVPGVMNITLQDIGTITVHFYKGVA